MTELSAQAQFARDVVAQLRQAGHEALWAGGCVRDQLLEKTPKDYDVATSATPDQVRDLFGRRRTIPVGASFGVITLLGPAECQPIEVATFRTDGPYGDGRRPQSVAFSDAEHDAQRRDFGINGMFYDPLSKELVDYVGGRDDLAARCVRAIGDPRRRFTEDKLRMLRAVRFAAALEFQIDPQTMAAIQEMAPDLAVVSAERIGAELRRMLTHPSRRRAAELLAESQLMPVAFPELASAAACRNEIWQRLCERSERLGESTLSAGLAAWIADLGDRVDVKEVARRLRFTTKEGVLAAWLVERLATIARASELSWPQRQRIWIHEGCDQLLALATAEWGADHPGVTLCREERSLPLEKLNPPPLATGDDLLRAGIPAGRHMGELLEHLRDQQLTGDLTSPAQAIAAAQEWLQPRPNDRPV